MIVTTTCDLCGWNNDNNPGPCRRCGSQTRKSWCAGNGGRTSSRRPRLNCKATTTRRSKPLHPSGPPRRGVRLGDGEVTLREFVAMIALLALVWAAVIASVVWTIRIVAG